MRTRHWSGEAIEQRGKSVARDYLAFTQSIGEPTHRHDGFDRRGVRCVVGEHLRGELPNRVLLHIGVLELTEAVLQLLQIVDERALRNRVV